MLRQRRAHVIPYRKLNCYTCTKNVKIKSKCMCQCKCKTEANQNDFLGMNRFKDKSKSLLYKFIWFMVIIGSFTGCIIQITIRVMQFFDDAIVIEIKLTDRTSVTFPSITICNSNLFDIIYNENETNSNEDIDYIDYINTDQFWSEFGINPADITIKTECEDGRRCIKPVTNSMMVEFVNTMYGRCAMLTKKSEMDFIGQSTYTTLIWAGNETFNNYSDNLVFSIHQDTFHHVYDGFPIMEEAVFDYISLYRIYSKKLQNLNTNKNPCVPEEIAHACLNDCINKEMIIVSSCGLPFINNSNLKQCTGIKEIQQNYYKMFPIWIKMKYYFKKCSCHRKCNEMQFIVNQNDKSKTDLNATMITLLLAGDKDELIIEKQMLTAIALFSEIGGTMGLYLGLSIVAIVDFLENLIRYSLLHFKSLTFFNRYN